MLRRQWTHTTSSRDINMSYSRIFLIFTMVVHLIWRYMAALYTPRYGRLSDALAVFIMLRVVRATLLHAVVALLAGPFL